MSQMMEKNKQESKEKRNKNTGQQKVKRCKLAYKRSKCAGWKVGKGRQMEEGKPQAAINVFVSWTLTISRKHYYVPIPIYVAFLLRYSPFNPQWLGLLWLSSQLICEALSRFCNSRFLTAVAELNYFWSLSYLGCTRLTITQLAFNMILFNKEKWFYSEVLPSGQISDHLLNIWFMLISVDYCFI